MFFIGVLVGIFLTIGVYLAYLSIQGALLKLRRATYILPKRSMNVAEQTMVDAQPGYHSAVYHDPLLK